MKEEELESKKGRWESQSGRTTAAVVLKRQMSSCSTSVAVNWLEQRKESYEEGEKQALVVAGFPHTNKSSCARKGFSLLHAGTCHLVKRNQAAMGLPRASPLRSVPAAKPRQVGPHYPPPPPQGSPGMQILGGINTSVWPKLAQERKADRCAIFPHKEAMASSSARSRGGNKSAVRQSSIQKNSVP